MLRLIKTASRDPSHSKAMTDSHLDPMSLAAQISGKGLPPVHLWNPEFCGDIDIRIARDGTWFYMGSPIGRQRLVRLFSTVLRKDDDGEFYLVTPVEKLRIQVEDAPFLVVQVDEKGQDENQQIYFRTKTDDVILADAQHRIWVEFADDGEPSPYVEVRDGLYGLIARNVYYQLVELGVERDTGEQRQFGVWSAGQFFVLGEVE